MKKTLVIFLFGCFLASNLFAQINIGGKIKNKVNQKIDRKADEAIDKTLDKAENDAKAGKKGKEAPQEPESVDGGEAEATSKSSTSKGSDDIKDEALVTYSKYDFVPGDVIIFEDNLQEETLGEFPSKWNLVEGTVEVAKFNNEKVISLNEGPTFITPFMTKKGDYLPEVFTIEFDAYLSSYPYAHENLFFHFYDRANPEYGYGEKNKEIGDLYSRMEIGKESKALTAKGKYQEEFMDRWHHFSIAYNKGGIKFYIDQYRVINFPRATGNPHAFSLGASLGNLPQAKPIFIKNIRIAEGGSDFNKRVATDGKIVTRGILFDVNKATIKPHSMGTINKIATLMEENPDLKFSIEGHTDSDGDDAANMKLSQERSEAVKAVLVNLGIDGSRLTTKGFGESKPVSDENTPEGKANNRRVEFIKT